MTTQDKPKRSGIQVISRAATILRLLQHSSQPTSLGSISKQINLPRSTVQRIVDALSKEGFVISGSSSAQGVRLGPAFLAMANAAQFSLKDLARPILESLAYETNESVVLTTLSNNLVITLDQVQSSNRLISMLETGSTLPLHCSASGKAMLAMLESSEVDRLLTSDDLTRFTENTITSTRQLKSELEKIRTLGFAHDHEEHSYGICASAIAARTVTDSLFTLAVTVPAARHNETKQSIVEQLKKHIEKLKGII